MLCFDVRPLNCYYENTVVHRSKVMKQLVWWLKPLALQAWNPGYVASQPCNVAKSFKFKSQYSHDEIVSTSEWVLNEMIHVKHSTMRWHTGHSIATNSYENMRTSAPVIYILLPHSVKHVFSIIPFQLSQFLTIWPSVCSVLFTPTFRLNFSTRKYKIR